jgi:hypothetical protein
MNEMSKVDRLSAGAVVVFAIAAWIVVAPAIITSRADLWMKVIGITFMVLTGIVFAIRVWLGVHPYYHPKARFRPH